MLRFISFTFHYNRYRINDTLKLPSKLEKFWFERFYLTIRLKRGWTIRLSRNLG